MYEFIGPVHRYAPPSICDLICCRLATMSSIPSLGEAESASRDELGVRDGITVSEGSRRGFVHLTGRLSRADCLSQRARSESAAMSIRPGLLRIGRMSLAPSAPFCECVLVNACETLAATPAGITLPQCLEKYPLQALGKRFSGPIRALPPEPAGADAWRATTYGHGVLQTNPHGSALDQVTQVRILEGQSNPARCVCRAFSLPDPVVSADDHAGRVTPSEGNRRL